MNELIHVFGSQEPTGALVTWVIVACFAIGVVDVLRSRARLRLERQYVADARSALAGVTAPAPDALLEKLDVPETSLLGRRITRVLQLRAAGLANRDVLQKLTIEHVEGYGATARFVGTILTMLGLVGTVVGMSFAMVRMSGAIRNVNDVQALAQLTQALSGTLQGMQTAFACTLAGLSTAVMLALLNYSVRRRQSQVFRELEEFVACELMPILERVDPEADNAARAFAEVLTDATEHLTTFCTTLADVSDRYAGASDELTRSASTLTAAVQQFATAAASLDGRVAALEESARTSRALQDSIVNYNEQFRALAERQTSQLEQGVKQLLHNVNEHYRDGVKKHVEASQERLAQLIEDNNTRFSDVMGLHSTKLQSFSDMMLELYVNGRKAPAAPATPTKDGQP